MYKVFFNRSQIMFPDDISQGEGAIITDPDEGTVKAIISDCLGKGSVKIAFFSSRQDELINLFNKNFDIIPASGGIVRNVSTGKILLIHRGDMWDLPKGWTEKGESPEEGALREVREETGIRHLENEGFVNTTRHAYMLKGRLALKSTSWFAMRTDETHTTPQTEEGIDRAEWFSRDELHLPMENTYDNIRETINAYMEKYPLR
ncbi:MAG: NUDIX domain-containing protein [Flavobacteriales bacterium]|nr:NUDIX domain-containing protein [Flavobacteriales bacterium]